jgi:hypothetical protein
LALRIVIAGESRQVGRMALDGADVADNLSRTD